MCWDEYWGYRRLGEQVGDAEQLFQMLYLAGPRVTA
jgi:hypothetical protein